MDLFAPDGALVPRALSRDVWNSCIVPYLDVPSVVRLGLCTTWLYKTLMGGGARVQRWTTWETKGAWNRGKDHGGKLPWGLGVRSLRHVPPCALMRR